MIYIREGNETRRRGGGRWPFGVSGGGGQRGKCWGKGWEGEVSREGEASREGRRGSGGAEGGIGRN